MSSRKGPIVIIEDDIDDQGFFIEALSNIRNAKLCGLANNGKEALHELKHSGVIPDTIFININMPLMNGIECSCALINIPRISHIPVIMLSTEVDQVEFCCWLEQKGYIKKPADITALQTELNRVIYSDSCNYKATKALGNYK